MNNLIETKTGQNPILLECPHSGRVGLDVDSTFLPNLIRDRLRSDSEAVLRTINFGCDQAVPYMVDFNDLVNSVGCSLLRDHFARSLTDVNRAESDVSGLVLEGNSQVAHNSGVIVGQTVPMNVVFQVAPDEEQFLPEFPSSRKSSSYLTEIERQARAKFEPMYQRPFTKCEFDELLNFIYRPYHRELKAHHDFLVEKHGVAIHLSLHTLPPAHVAMVDGGYVLGENAGYGEFDISRGVLPDVILIHNEFAAADPRIIDTVRKGFEYYGLIVSDGAGPFKGANGVTGIYGNPDNGVNVIGIEHVPHGVELNRHQGGLDVDYARAMKFREVYKKVVSDLLGQI